MASGADYTNPVPLGEAGTGAAYILPQSSALAGFDNYLDQQGVQRQKDAAAKAAQAVQIAKNWKEAQLNIKGGTIFQPEINQRANHVMQMGMDLQRLGVDPQGFSNNPQTQALLSHYQQERASLLSDSEMRDKIATEAQAAHKAYSEQAAGYYDPASMDDINNYVSGKGKYGSLSDISANGYQLPTLQRAYDMQGAVDKLPTHAIKTSSIDPKTGVQTELSLPDTNAHAQIAQSAMVNNPEMKSNIEKQIGMPMENLPSTSDIPTIKSQLDQKYRSMPSIPGLAAQGFKTFGQFGQTNSNGIPDATSNPQDAAPGQTPTSPSYDQFITGQATKLGQARQRFDQIHQNITDQLDDKVAKDNKTDYNFAYQREMRERQERGEGQIRFAQWMKDQQSDSGQTVLGNAGGNVPVVYSAVGNGKMDANGNPQVILDRDGNPVKSKTVLQPSASLFTTKLPSIDVTVQPSSITDYDNETGGRTTKNAGPVSMKVSGIKMVPVWKGANDNDRDRNKELSATQLQDVINGKWPGKSPEDITYKPMVYGMQDKKDEKGIHKVYTPISIPYADFKGEGSKKVNTSGFDKYYQQFQDLSKNPKFMALSAQQKAQFIQQFYNQQTPQP